MPISHVATHAELSLHASNGFDAHTEELGELGEAAAFLVPHTAHLVALNG